MPKILDSPVVSEERFRELFDAYFPSVVRFFRRRGFATSLAEDLAQEVFFRVYKGIGELRRDASAKAWIFQIATNIWKNALRTRGTQKRQGEEMPLDELVHPEGSQSPRRHCEPEDASSGPLDQVLAAEKTRVLEEALDELPERMRQNVELRLKGYTYREIATVLGVTTATVKTQLSMAKQRLRPQLAPYFGDDLWLDGDEEV